MSKQRFTCPNCGGNGDVYQWYPAPVSGGLMGRLKKCTLCGGCGSVEWDTKKHVFVKPTTLEDVKKFNPLSKE